MKAIPVASARIGNYTFFYLLRASFTFELIVINSNTGSPSTYDHNGAWS